MSEKRLRRADDGTVVSGWGSELTDLQRTFIERVQNEGLYSAARIAREMNYKSYYRDKANEGTAFPGYSDNLGAINFESFFTLSSRNSLSETSLRVTPS